MDNTKQAVVLIVEDEVASMNLLASYLENEGYQVLKAVSGDEASNIISTEAIDVVLLDINLPGKDGLTVLKEIRVNTSMGVILVTSKKDDIDRIVGLELGADDYVTKPYNPRELIVRIRNLIQRLKPAPISTANFSSHQQSKIIRFGPWSLNKGRRLLSNTAQQNIQLTEGEFKLLMALIDRAGEVLSRDSLMNHMEGRDWFPNDRTIDVLVARIRKKLGDNRDEPKFINTAHGAGYIFVAEINSDLD